MKTSRYWKHIRLATPTLSNLLDYLESPPEDLKKYFMEATREYYLTKPSVRKKKRFEWSYYEEVILEIMEELLRREGTSRAHLDGLIKRIGNDRGAQSNEQKRVREKMYKMLSEILTVPGMKQKEANNTRITELLQKLRLDI